MRNDTYLKFKIYKACTILLIILLLCIGGYFYIQSNIKVNFVNPIEIKNENNINHDYNSLSGVWVTRTPISTGIDFKLKFYNKKGVLIENTLSYLDIYKLELESTSENTFKGYITFLNGKKENVMLTYSYIDKDSIRMYGFRDELIFIRG